MGSDHWVAISVSIYLRDVVDLVKPVNALLKTLVDDPVEDLVENLANWCHPVTKIASNKVTPVMGPLCLWQCL